MIQARALLQALAIFVIASLPWTSVGQSSSESLAVRWVPNNSGPHRASACAYGLPIEILRRAGANSAECARLLTVHSGSNDLVPMAGMYTVETNVLRFDPQFPLEPGVNYTAVLSLGELMGTRSENRNTLTASIRLPPPAQNSTTVVSRICPTAAVLPENLLKFYIHFSAPMSRGSIYDYIHLRKENGKDVELPFLEIDEELWDLSMTRLTLLLDPGRIKRGVRPLEEVGPALENGKRYTLVIDKAWHDAGGNPLAASFQKQFRVGPVDREPPKPAAWKIHAPRSNTREPLRIDFRKPMDEALAQRTLQVIGPSGSRLNGEVTLKDHEQTWRFIPDVAWAPGACKILVGSTIEDLAGNNIGKPFDVDLFERVDNETKNRTIDLPFEVR